MAKYFINDTTLTGIADAIRSKTGGTEPILTSEMAESIERIYVPEAEEQTVALAMADGDMVVEPSAEDKVFSKVTITKPETLLPENIAEGVDIAGIIGTLAGGGSANMAFGVVTETQITSSAQITHGLGVIPDILIVAAPALVTSGVILNVGFSSAFAALIGTTVTRSSVYKDSSGTTTCKFHVNHDITKSLQLGSSGLATETTFYAGATTTVPLAAGTLWFAIGGLT